MSTPTMYDSAASLSQLQTWFELSQFFAREADLLDSGREAEWLELLAPTFRYRVPLRSVRLRKEGWSAQFSDTGFHIDDDRGAVEQRVRRLATGSAYAEDPVSRSRHHVSCVRVLDADAQGVWRCESNVLLTRRNGPETQTAVISAHRFDRVRREAGRWLLVERIVHLDHTVLPMNNLAVII